MLMKHKLSSRFLLLLGKVPCPLQTMDATTAANIKASQQRVEALTVGAEGLAKLFKMRVTLACSDRAASNLSAEKTLRQDAERAGCSTILTHTPCDIHKLSTCEKATLNLVSSHVSGMVNTGLATRIAGSKDALRRHLFDVIQERLEVRIGPPQCVEARNKVYDLLLQNLCTGYADQEKYRRAQQMLHQKQRLIFNKYLNGNIEEEGVVVHYVSSPRPRDAVLDDFKRFVIPALVPTPCPLLNRSKFMAFEATAKWIGVLAVHHNLLAPLMERYHGKSEAAAPLVQMVLGRPTPGVGWFAAGLRRVEEARSQNPDAATRRRGLSSIVGQFAMAQMEEEQAADQQTTVQPDQESVPQISRAFMG